MYICSSHAQRLQTETLVSRCSRLQRAGRKASCTTVMTEHDLVMQGHESRDERSILVLAKMITVGPVRLPIMSKSQDRLVPHVTQLDPLPCCGSAEHAGCVARHWRSARKVAVKERTLRLH
jgi:hypothetical protein